MFLACSDRPFFFFNSTSTHVNYTLSLHDALPISSDAWEACNLTQQNAGLAAFLRFSERLNWKIMENENARRADRRSEEHTSELQSLRHLVCRLLLEKKKISAMLAERHAATTISLP